MIDPRRYTMVDHTITVPLDYARPDGETIEVFARELGDVEKVGEGSWQRDLGVIDPGRQQVQDHD